MAATPVEPGDTWTQVQQIPNKEDASAAPQVDGTTEYTLDEVTKKDGKKVAKILGKGRAKVNMQSSMGPVTGDVHGESAALVSVEDGLLLELKSSSDFAGTMGANKGPRRILRAQAHTLSDDPPSARAWDEPPARRPWNHDALRPYSQLEHPKGLDATVAGAWRSRREVSPPVAGAVALGVGLST